MIFLPSQSPSRGSPGSAPKCSPVLAGWSVPVESFWASMIWGEGGCWQRRPRAGGASRSWWKWTEVNWAAEAGWWLWSRGAAQLVALPPPVSCRHSICTPLWTLLLCIKGWLNIQTLGTGEVQVWTSLGCNLLHMSLSAGKLVSTVYHGANKVNIWSV